MSLPKNPDDGNKPKRSLPPELEFLTNIRDILKLDEEELLVEMRRQHALIRQHADLIRAHGMDPDYMISLTEPTLLALEEACRKCDDANEKMFQAMADSADAQRALFKASKEIVEQAHEERPFDEKVQEAKEFIEEWSKQMPKE